jgi:hypothetical protein
VLRTARHGEKFRQQRATRARDNTLADLGLLAQARGEASRNGPRSSGCSDPAKRKRSRMLSSESASGFGGMCHRADLPMLLRDPVATGAGAMKRGCKFPRDAVDQAGPASRPASSRAMACR